MIYFALSLSTDEAIIFKRLLIEATIKNTASAPPPSWGTYFHTYNWKRLGEIKYFGSTYLNYKTSKK